MFPSRDMKRQWIWLGRFPKVRTGRPDHGRTCHFSNEIGFFQKVLLNKNVFFAFYLEFDLSGRIVLIKREFLITVGMVWPVSSDKWKVTLVRVALKKRVA